MKTGRVAGASMKRGRVTPKYENRSSDRREKIIVKLLSEFTDNKQKTYQDGSRWA
jgi:hypothetical protein